MSPRACCLYNRLERVTGICDPANLRLAALFGQAYAESMRKGISTAGYVWNGGFGSEGGHYMNDAPKGRSGSVSGDRVGQ